MCVCASTTSLLEWFPHKEIFHNIIHVVFIFLFVFSYNNTEIINLIK